MKRTTTPTVRPVDFGERNFQFYCLIDVLCLNISSVILFTVHSHLNILEYLDRFVYLCVQGYPANLLGFTGGTRFSGSYVG